MKSLTAPVVSLLLFVSTASAQLPADNVKRNPFAQPKIAAARALDTAAVSNRLQSSGGLVYEKTRGPVVLLLNTQTRVPPESFDGVASYMQRIMRLPCSVKKQPSNAPVQMALTALSDTNTAAVVVIGESEGYPALLIAPESRWALVNVAALSPPGTSAETLSERTRKETWRAFGYLMGAGHSTGPGCILKPVFSLTDLDEQKAQRVGPEAFKKIGMNASKLGIQQTRLTTYRQAVEEGWAPPPANDFQRAIWNELKKK